METHSFNNNKNTAYASYKSKEISTLQRIFTFFGITDYQFTSDEYCVYDAIFTTAKGTFIVEIKCRDITERTYRTALIDSRKIEDITRIAEASGYTALVFYTWSDDILRIFNATQIQKSPKIFKNAPKSTAVSKENKISKEFYEFPLNIGKRIDLWSKQSF